MADSLSPNADTFASIVERRLSRRDFFRAAGAAAAGAALAGQAAARGNAATTFPPVTPVPASAPNAGLRVPNGYTYEVLLKWGQPILPPGPDDFDPLRLTAEEQKRRFGYNCDFVGFLPMGALLLIVPLITRQAGALSEALPTLYENARHWLVNSELRIFRQIGYRLETTPTIPGAAPEELDGQALATLSTAGYVLFVTISTFVFAYYWLLYRERSLRGLLHRGLKMLRDRLPPDLRGDTAG